MSVKKVAEGAYFVRSYSVQTVASSYDPTTSQQVLSSSNEKENEADKADSSGERLNDHHLDPESNPLSEMRSR